MIDLAKLRRLRSEATDETTRALIEDLATLKKDRDPLYLSAIEMERIFRWKLRSQYGRQEELRARNPSAVYEAATRAAFSVHNDFDYELVVRTQLLTAVPGVGVGVASAVLALAELGRYCVVDYRGWRQVCENEKTIFSVRDFLAYAHKVREIAGNLGWTVQETDAAIWEYDRRHESSGE